jgi:hypothetical protein
MLSIVVPPDFIPEETSGDVTVSEGWHVSIKQNFKNFNPTRM